MSSPIIKLPQVPNNLDPELRDYLLNINKILIKKQNEEFGGFKEQVVDLLYPVGERYIQLPEPDGTFSSAKSPEVKFGGEWACIFDEEGVFFKTEGHEPTQYYKADSDGTPTLTPYRNDNGLAEDKIQYITGDLRIWGAAAGPSSSYGTGQVKFIQNTGNRYSSGVGGNAPLFTISPIYSPYNKSTSNLDGRTEPTNRLMRIWERVA